MTDSTYPVISERPLDRPRSSFLKFARRDLSELPRQEPGTVLVFDLGNRYAVFEDRRHLTGREEAVVEAVAVSLVHVRPRRVTVDIRIPSKSPADVFRVRVAFQCRVTDPETVVRDGLLDVTGPLLDHIKRDRELDSLGVSYPVDAINEVRDEVNAELSAYCTIHPPRIRGMEVEFGMVEVATPSALVDHASKIRDTKWQQNLKDLEGGFVTKQAEELADLIRTGPEVLEALAIARGETRVSHAADRAYARSAEDQGKITELLAILQKDGHLERLNVDPSLLVQAFTDSLRLRRSEPASGIESGGGPGQRPRSITAEGGDDLLLDEDELNDEQP
ncbi:hypothetical protein [Micromonospora sp. DT62]|uniref:hypothetical protein n=1 Tax=Micromonospora sp. DT62 TaxID=3416521 RepID=UPI003CF3C2C9